MRAIGRTARLRACADSRTMDRACPVCRALSGIPARGEAIRSDGHGIGKHGNSEAVMGHTAHTDHFASFAEFYPFYLSEHRNTVSRRLHFVGSLGVIGCLAMALATGHWLWLPVAVVCGYGFAWVGHFFFEKNRPATFRHPLYSLMGDWVMFKDICVGKISL
jgi:hypothetical protein